MANELCVMDRTGDTRTIWNPDNEDETAAAKATFDRLKKKGYLAYRVDKSGDKAEAMSEFDPRAGKVILCPAVVGG